jgi:FkbM family methyltransferase
MKLLQIIRIGLQYKRWTFSEVITLLISRIASKLKIMPIFFNEYHQNNIRKNFKKRWLRKNEKREPFFDFKGALIPDISSDKNIFRSLMDTFGEVFWIPCFYNDNYDKSVIEELYKYSELLSWEGPYGYSDATFDVTVKKGDVVIDAGAWIGDFSSYAVSKGAVVYAFEPVENTFHWLRKTSDLNEGNIYPVKKGLGSKEEELTVLINKENSVANSFIIERKDATTEEKLCITTLDKFVEENNLKKIDFIKADIEGAERDLLIGATNVLKEFAPKLIICTYHLPDDPEVLEKIIIEANPNYKIVHLKHKLFAMI